jgi:hypothetical protein
MNQNLNEDQTFNLVRENFPERFQAGFQNVYANNNINTVVNLLQQRYNELLRDVNATTITIRNALVNYSHELFVRYNLSENQQRQAISIFLANNANDEHNNEMHHQQYDNEL